MTTQALLPEFTISELYFTAWKSGRINRQHRQQIESAILTNSLSEPDRKVISRLLYAVRRGWLSVVD
ncbi:hypothetical protein [Kamptonema sp. UHCC 0994]|uniref:hypothetical protein n=1 Tax=Kamptonema sp. UHCC 0994 TaxID=3031329 RepID=UPI0023B97D33|nr:hypothetical protein [Kamptonema sp. UHCC 0994]MDF0555538.1 hypothetical protein [Kamptonema sp. UHCC 0994]